MREIIPPQVQLGEQDIGAIEIDGRSRDDIPRLLRGLQSIDVTPEVRERVFAILAEVVPLRSDGTGAVSTETGRPGMTQWQMLVLGTLRLGLNADSVTPRACVIETSAGLCAQEDLSDWRQSAYNVRCLKKAYRRVQPLERSTSSDEDKRAARAEAIKHAHRDDLALAEQVLARAWLTRSKLLIGCRLPAATFSALDDDIAHAERQIDQIRRRVLLGERILHAEKVFSICEPHTEWISKGKAGVPVELGLRLSVSEDHYGFILSHRVMQHETDDQVAVPLVEALTARFPTLTSVSFDQGFHSPANQQRLAEMIDLPVLPKKGKCSPAEHAREHHPDFQSLRRRHSAVASAINALEAHGLDRCPDHGIDGFKRYVALAVVARNLHRLGAILIAQDAEQAQRQRQRAA